MTDLDVAEAARALGVTERTIRRWLKDGRLAGFKVGGRIRIPERAVREVASPYGSAEGEGPAVDVGRDPDVDAVVRGDLPDGALGDADATTHLEAGQPAVLQPAPDRPLGDPQGPGRLAGVQGVE